LRELNKLECNINFNKLIDIVNQDSIELYYERGSIKLNNLMVIIKRYIDGISLKKFIKISDKYNFSEVLIQLFMSLYLAIYMVLLCPKTSLLVFVAGVCEHTLAGRAQKGRT